jgi:ADP-heptose:LPS heptosyltransferase
VVRSLERALKLLLTSLLRFLFGLRRHPPFSPEGSAKILIIRQHNQLGDMLCVVPLLRALRRRYPEAHVALMASPVNGDVMLGNRYIDELLLFDKREFLGRFGGKLIRFPRFVKGLRGEGFGIVVVPSTVSTSFTSDFLAFLTGARIRVGAGSIDGARNPTSFFFTHARHLDWRGEAHKHQVERNIDVWPEPLRSFDNSLEITLTEDELNEGKSFLQKEKTSGQKVIVYHPGAGKEPNRWPAPRFAELARALSRETGAKTVITCGPMDAGPVREMIANLNSPPQLLENKPIRFVASVLSHSDLVISNDTGIMHVAAAVGAPVLSLFGPTDPLQWAPIGGRHRFMRGEGGAIARLALEDVASVAREMLRVGA